MKNNFILKVVSFHVMKRIGDSDKECNESGTGNVPKMERRAEQVMFRSKIIGEFFGWRWPHLYYNIAQKTRA